LALIELGLSQTAVLAANFSAIAADADEPNRIILKKLRSFGMGYYVC